MTITKEDIKALSMQEREELLTIFWDVMEEEPYVDNAGEETAEELSLLKESLEEYNRDPSAAKTWEKVYLELRGMIND